MKNYSISISGKMFNIIRDHLYPGDGKEAVVIAICGRHNSAAEHRLLVHKVIPIPYEECDIRSEHQIQWSTKRIIPHLEWAANKGMAVIKIHSHPTGYNGFSKTDDYSDLEFFDSVYGWMNTEEPHASAIMLPDGSIIARVITSDNRFLPIDKVSVIGDDLEYFFRAEKINVREFARRTAQAFGSGTISLLNQLKIGVVGCSGTGSPIIEQLVRLGVGTLVLIDPDKIEEKNLNRIINSTKADCDDKRYKVHVFEEAIHKIGLGTKVITHPINLFDSREAIADLCNCDAVFGCMDSIDGRHLLNHLASFYLLPYFDLGVKLISDGKGGISKICGTVHYLQPGGSSLLTRGVYTPDDLRASGLKRTNKSLYNELRQSAYIVDIQEDRPAVISVNMQIASYAINEFLARIHPYRHDPNATFAVTRINISDGYIQYEEDGVKDEYLFKYIGRGSNITPFLNMPNLTLNDDETPQSLTSA